MSLADRFERFSGTDEVRGDLKRKSVHGALFMGLGQGGELVLRFGAILILARILAPEDFGLLGMVVAVTGIAEQFSTLGLSTATVQAPKITHQQCSNLFWINLGAGILLAGIVCALGPAVSGFYGDERLLLITAAISLSFVFRGMAVQHEALLNRQMKLPQIAGNDFAASLLSTVLAVVLALSGFGYWALVWREVARASLTVLGVFLLCRWIPGRPARNAGIGKLIRFGGDMTLTQLLIAVITRLDSLLIGKFAGAVALGFYRQAYNLIMGPMEQLNSPIFNVSQPGLSVLQDDPGRYRRYYERIVLIVSLVTVPLGVFTFIYAREIVLIMLGEKWLSSVVFLQIFGIMAAIRPAVATSGTVLITCGRSARFLKMAVAHSALLALAMCLGIRWGATGIALAHLGTTLVMIVPKLIYSFSGTPVTAGGFFRTVAKPVVAGTAMGTILYLQRSSLAIEGPILSVIAGCLTAAAAYLGTLAVLPRGWREIRDLAAEIVGEIARRRGAPAEAAETT